MFLGVTLVSVCVAIISVNFTEEYLQRVEQKRVLQQLCLAQEAQEEEEMLMRMRRGLGGGALALRVGISAKA